MNKLYMLWADALGRTRLTSVYFDNTPEETLAALTLLSNAVPMRWVWNEPVPQEPVVTTGAYQAVDAAMYIELADVYNGRVTVAIPAPKAVLFDEDGVTPSYAAISDLVENYLLGVVLTREGLPAVRYVRSWLRTRSVRS